MRLSRHSQAVYDITQLPSDICNLIGQFARRDVTYRKGDCFYEAFRKRGASYLITEWGEGTFYLVANNEYIHYWRVVSTTPCSIIVEYIKTFAMCRILGGTLLRYPVFLEELQGRKRAFPLKRTQAHHNQVGLQCFISLHETELMKPAIRYKKSFVFLLPYEDIFHRYRDQIPGTIQLT